MHPKLFPYGIQLERSDIRVHVSPATRRLYVFPTAEAQKLLDERGGDFPQVTASQKGVSYPTSMGRLVPCQHMPKLQIVTLDAAGWWDKFNPNHQTSKKGNMAVKVVLWALRNGRLPLWISNAVETKDMNLQVRGTDIVLWARIRIQVKCDWEAGPVEWGGSGNLFLQQAEINPRKRY